MFQGGSAETNLSETSRNRVLSVAYWRFFVNALLILCDMASFIVASAIIYVWQGGGSVVFFPFPFSYRSVVVCACLLVDLDLLPAQCWRVPPSCDG